LADIETAAPAVARRFDELIVDEAQDTTDTQLTCLELLKRAGLRSLVLIGDPDQAIYGFAGSEPERLLGLCTDLGLDRLELSENWRSSQVICETTVHFGTRDEPDVATGPSAKAGHAAELIVYPGNEPRRALELFEGRLAELGLEDGRVAVLCRSRATCDEVNGTGGGVFRGRMADLAELAEAVQQGRTVGSSVVTPVEAEIVRLAFPDLLDEDMDDDLRLKIRQETFALAQRLDPTTTTATEWCKTARAQMDRTLDRLSGGSEARFRAQTPRGTGALVVADLLEGRRGARRAKTIHMVKGESYDAILTVAVASERFDNVADWLEPGEEQRVAYVALTRARRYVAIAVPASTSSAHLDDLLARGFCRI
jgi:superfamily I DNA/RNA helicase